MKFHRKIQAALARRVKSYNEGPALTDRGMRKPGSQNRKKGLGLKRR